MTTTSKLPKIVCPKCSSNLTTAQITVCTDTYLVTCYSCGSRNLISVKSQDRTPTVETNPVCVASRNTQDSSGRANELRRRVLAYIRSKGTQGATCDEIERALKRKHQSVSCTITFLKNPKYGKPLIKDSGQTRINPETKREVTVYVCIDIKQYELAMGA